jgi:ubiquitin carboxyl-terminal hydrolase 8
MEKGRQEHEESTYDSQIRRDSASSSSTMQSSDTWYNIAQMRDEPHLNVEHETPHYDQAIGPLAEPQCSEVSTVRGRNFIRKLVNRGHGITGLKNLGNSCYMSSIIQCISNTTPLALYFCKGVYLEDVNRDNNNTRGKVAEEVAAVVSVLWSGQFRCIAYPDLKNVLGQHMEQYQGSEQQDSHEFHIILMDLLHEDLNTSSRKSPLRETSNDDLSPADQAWEKFLRCNESIIQILFYGQQKSTVRCCKCGEESVIFEAFSDLSLSLPSCRKKCSLDECMELYLNGENISGWNCPSCMKKGDAIKKFDIWRLPPILVIHLNRFYHDGCWRKRKTFVDFPFNMDMHYSSLASDQQCVSYKLYGVSNHYGSMESGHYTAYCKNELYNKWYEFDDHKVSEISDNEIRSDAAYILFYTYVECKTLWNSS